MANRHLMRAMGGPQISSGQRVSQVPLRFPAQQGLGEGSILAPLWNCVNASDKDELGEVLNSFERMSLREVHPSQYPSRSRVWAGAYLWPRGSEQEKGLRQDGLSAEAALPKRRGGA